MLFASISFLLFTNGRLRCKKLYKNNETLENQKFPLLRNKKTSKNLVLCSLTSAVCLVRFSFGQIIKILSWQIYFSYSTSFMSQFIVITLFFYLSTYGSCLVVFFPHSTRPVLITIKNCMPLRVSLCVPSSHRTMSFTIYKSSSCLSLFFGVFTFFS
jgi:hypothetical protein